MKNLTLLVVLLLLVGCSAPDSAPDSAPNSAPVVASAPPAPLVAVLPEPDSSYYPRFVTPPADTAAFHAMRRADWARKPSTGPFSGEWYQDTKYSSSLQRLRITHDTLGRYEVDYSMMSDPQNTEGERAYTIADSLFIYGDHNHHSPPMGIHLARKRQLLIRSFRPVEGLMRAPNEPMVRDTFWRDSLRARKRR